MVRAVGGARDVRRWSGMDVELFTTSGLGDASYLVASDGEAALVDPQRDAWRFLEVAARRGWRVTHVLETHVHNDYLSGALEARAATGASIVAPARGRYAFPHVGADEGTTVEVGGLRLTALATPGHTPEHLSWAVRPGDVGDDTPPDGVFTGGSLLVGTAGRTDLLGDARTEELTRLQAATLRRLAARPPAASAAWAPRPHRERRPWVPSWRRTRRSRRPEAAGFMTCSSAASVGFPPITSTWRPSIGRGRRFSGACRSRHPSTRPRSNAWSPMGFASSMPGRGWTSPRRTSLAR